MKVKKINGIRIYPFSARSHLLDYIDGKKGILVAVNAEKILHATDEIRTIINNNIGYADGIGAVWALKKKGLKNTVKIPGCELWLDIVRRYCRTKTFYLVGAKDEVINRTVKMLKNNFPNINILGYRNGYIESEEEKMILINDIRLKKPDIIFVAIGSPKQELLMQEMQKKHVAIYMGLGGSFDLYIGRVSRASKWWLNAHLEWAYRFIKQPSRFVRQVYLIKFLWLLISNRL